MAIKVVILFQDTTGFTPSIGQFGVVIAQASAPTIGYFGRQHIGGWSESLWWGSDVVADLFSALTTGLAGLPALLPARAALLPNSAGIIGVRLYQGGAGKGISRSLAYPGNPANTSDVPQMALLCKGGAVNFAVSRRFTLRCIPDIFVAQGEFAPSNDYANAVALYFSALNNFAFLATNPITPANSAAIFNIVPLPLVPPAPLTGQVTVVPNVQPFAVGQLVTVQRALSPGQTFSRFTGMVTAIGPLGNQFVMQIPVGAGPWTGGLASVKTKSLYFLSASQSAVSRAVVRKVGRPFEQYRGRRSKRRLKTL